MTPDRGENTTDLGNARRLVRIHGADLRYHVGRRGWMIWDGKRWRPDETGEVTRRAKHAVCTIYAEAAAATELADRQRLANWALRSEGARGIRDMVELAKSEPGIPITAAELDADPWLFNVATGTVDLRTGELLPHRREDLISKLAPTTYDASAECHRWLAFLARIFDGNTELVRFVQKAVGYSLTASTREQVLFFLYGTGANGKTTLLEIVRRLMGDYVTQAEFSSFTERRGEGPRNDLAKLRGARFVAASEANENRKLDEALVKTLTGGDTITARYLFGEFFEFTPSFKLWLAANHRPNVHSVGEAMWRRIRLIPFTVTIPEQERDPNLVATLTDELPGILRWAVEGCLSWQSEGLTAPLAVIDATAEYRTEMDVLAGFLVERCLVNPLARVAAGALYQAYRKWAEENGERHLTQTAFGTRLRERGVFNRTKNRTGWFWHGIGLVGDGVTSRDEFSPINTSTTPLVLDIGKISHNPSPRHTEDDTERGDSWEPEEGAA